jgi:transcriptional regulator with XRE-family HTH domain
MDSAGSLIRRERQALGLSTRHLAALAGISYPTISRIENGHDEPQWGTMQKIAAALGKSCSFTQRSFTRLADLARPADGAIEAEPDWTRLRGFADQLALRPELTAAATADPPPPSGSPFIDNLLAALAEKLAANVGIRPAPWVSTIEPLDTTWEAPGTPRRRALAAAQTPPEFAARNIILPQSAIWRDRATVKA